MDDNEKYFDTLLKRAVDYGKINLEILKLKALDVTSEVVSSLVSQALSIVLLASFWFFLNMGLALWFGELLGNMYYGFFVVTAFYGFMGLLYHFFIGKHFKRMVCNHIIKLLLK
jgi:hypothetical protein